jgi:hypothetical protein
VSSKVVQIAGTEDMLLRIRPERPVKVTTFSAAIDFFTTFSSDIS